MKIKNKILLNSLAIFVLLFVGCTDEQKAAAEAAMKSANHMGNSPEEDTKKNRELNLADIKNSDFKSPDDITDTKDGSGDDSNTGDGDIPSPGNDADIPGTAGTTTGGWYGRTVVSVTSSDGTVYQHSTAGVFGELIDSNESIDQHDIPSYGTAILQVVFPQDNGTDNGDFFSNYQNFDPGSKKTWTFQIKNQQTVDLKDASVSITLPEVKKVIYKKINGRIVYDKNEIVDNSIAAQLTLIDVDNATSYTVDQLATANLTMQGLHTRTFKWVLGTVEDTDYTATETAGSGVNILTSKSTNLTTEKNRMTADGFDTASVVNVQSEGGKFGLPPM